MFAEPKEGCRVRRGSVPCKATHPRSHDHLASAGRAARRTARRSGGEAATSGGSIAMLALLILLILLFLIFGGLGLFVAKWLLIICLVALVLALFTGGGYYRRR